MGVQQANLLDRISIEISGKMSIEISGRMRRR
jgi:hypothetical protein